jgi:hypothetical protein
MHHGHVDVEDMHHDMIRRFLMEGVRQEKFVTRLSERTFVAVNRAKVKGCTRKARKNISVETGDAEMMEFSSLLLSLDTERQRCKSITIGVVDLNEAWQKGSSWTDQEADRLAEWIIVDRVAILTGRFGSNTNMVSRIGEKAGAICMQPCYCSVRMTAVADSYQSRYRSHPSYFMLFGFFNSIAVHHEPSEVPSYFQVGDDIAREMIRVADMPRWRYNERGSALVPHLKKIRMKAVNWSHWIDNVYETFLHLGTSTQGRGSIWKPPHKGKDKGKGKGKGKDKGHPELNSTYCKGKDKGKGKGKDKGRPELNSTYCKGKGKGKGKGKDKLH